MQDVGPLAPHQGDELEHGQGIVPSVELPPEVPQRDEADSGGEGGVAQRSVAVRGDDDLESPDERRKEPGDVRLRAAGFGKSDEQKNPRSPEHRQRDLILAS